MINSTVLSFETIGLPSSYSQSIRIRLGLFQLLTINALSSCRQTTSLCRYPSTQPRPKRSVAAPEHVDMPDRLTINLRRLQQVDGMSRVRQQPQPVSDTARRYQHVIGGGNHGDRCLECGIVMTLNFRTKGIFHVARPPTPSGPLPGDAGG